MKVPAGHTPPAPPPADFKATGAHWSSLSDDSAGVDIPNAQAVHATVPFAPENEPLGHGVHDGAAPGCGDKVPGPHSLHEDDPWAENELAGHARHWSMPVPLA